MNPRSDHFRKKINFRLPGGVRESVLEPTLRRTTPRSHHKSNFNRFGSDLATILGDCKRILEGFGMIFGKGPSFLILSMHVLVFVCVHVFVSCVLRCLFFVICCCCCWFHLCCFSSCWVVLLFVFCCVGFVCCCVLRFCCCLLFVVVVGFVCVVLVLLCVVVFVLLCCLVVCCAFVFVWLFLFVVFRCCFVLLWCVLFRWSGKGQDLFLASLPSFFALIFTFTFYLFPWPFSSPFTFTLHPLIFTRYIYLYHSLRLYSNIGKSFRNTSPRYWALLLSHISKISRIKPSPAWGNHTKTKLASSLKEGHIILNRVREPQWSTTVCSKSMNLIGS